MDSRKDSPKCLVDFLREIGLDERYVTKIADEKIDSNALLLMEDSALKQYIPAYGDRIKAIAFCASQKKGDSSQTGRELDKTDNSDLLQRLKDKYHHKQHSLTLKHHGNKNAVRSKRRVELGWMDFDKSSKQYKQVRSQKGGGTRHLSVDKDLSMSDILETGKNLFFPDGKSPKGKLCDFHIELRDFREQEVHLHEFSTVEEAYEKTKLKILRLYLYTRPVKSTSTDGEREEKNKRQTSIEEIPCSTQETENDSADDFVSTDTPTIKFRRSRPHKPLLGRICMERRDCSTERGTLDADCSTERPQDMLDANCSTGKESLGESDSSERSTFDASCSSANILSGQQFCEVIDSEDEELQRALHASLMEVEDTQRNVTSCDLDSNRSPSVEEVLAKFQQRAVDTSDRTKIIVFRKKVLQSAFMGIARPTFKLCATLYVKFSGEIGEDFGGPRREFFRLAMKELQSSPLFEGEEGDKIFSHNVQLLEEEKYKLAGRLVALSFAQDGPAPHFFNELLFDLMTDSQRPERTSVENMENMNILPVNVQGILKQLTEMQSESQREKFLVDHGEWLIDQGIPNIWRLSIEKKMELADLLIKQLVYYRTSAEIAQFLKGMEEVCSFWTTVRKHATIFKPLFCYEVKPLSKEQFEGLCSISYSATGSNNKMKEDETVFSWEVFLQDISEGAAPVTFEDLLAFITGADRLPPSGFSKKIDIKFFSNEPGVSRFPSVSTCSLEMYLPRGIVDVSTFRELMIRALKESSGFQKI